MKTIALAAAVLCLPTACLAQSIIGNDGRVYTRQQVQAFLNQCSLEADARGLNVSEGYREARYAFRRECMHRFGIDPRQ